MAKGPKIRSSLLSSFQICRSKDPTSSVENPAPAVTYMLSPVNSKSFDISFLGYPNPPPSTPYRSTSRSIARPSKIAPFESECLSNSCTMHGENHNENKSQMFSNTRRKGKDKMYNSPISSDSEETACPNAAFRIGKSINSNIASVNSNETDSLFSSPLSSSSSHYYDYLLPPNIEEQPLNERKKPMKHKSARARGSMRFSSKERKPVEMTIPLGESNEKNITSWRIVHDKTDGEVYQSFVVVKQSVDPFEDFKKSMLEMILDKQIFRTKELEELLMSFLFLNSRLHHEVIIEAFIEIWKEVYSGT